MQVEIKLWAMIYGNHCTHLCSRLLENSWSCNILECIHYFFSPSSSLCHVFLPVVSWPSTCWSRLTEKGQYFRLRTEMILSWSKRRMVMEEGAVLGDWRNFLQWLYLYFYTLKNHSLVQIWCIMIFMGVLLFLAYIIHVHRIFKIYILYSILYYV